MNDYRSNRLVVYLTTPATWYRAPPRRYPGPPMRRLPRAGQLVVIAGLVGACRSVTPSQLGSASSVPDAGARADAPVTAVRSGVLDPKWLQPGTDTMLMSRAPDVHPVSRLGSGDRTIVGMTIETMRRRTLAGGRTVLEVSFEERDTTTVVARTTTQVDASSLLPIRQRAELDAGQVVILLYTGQHLLGIDQRLAGHRTTSRRLWPTRCTVRARSICYCEPCRSHPGFTRHCRSTSRPTTMPVRSEYASSGESTSRRAPDGQPTAGWSRLDFPGGITEHFWIEERSHAILRILAHDGETSLVRYDR